MYRKNDVSREDWEAARELYETDPSVTLEELSGVLDLPIAAVRTRSLNHGWLNFEERQRQGAMMHALAVSGIVGKVPADARIRSNRFQLEEE